MGGAWALAKRVGYIEFISVNSLTGSITVLVGQR